MGAHKFGVWVGMLANADTIIIELRGDVVAKGRPRFVRATGVAFTPSHTRRYESHLRLAAQDAMAGRAPLEGALQMCVRVTLPVPKSYSRRKRADALFGVLHPTKKPDWDNFGKIAADSLNAIVFRDDCQIVDGRIVKRYGDVPGIIIEVRTL